MPQSLAELRPGDRARVTSLEGDDATVQRLAEMGLTEDEVVEVIRLAPTGDPMEVRIRGYYLSLRRSQAAAVRVAPESA